jgi:hypothetical protein
VIDQALFLADSGSINYTCTTVKERKAIGKSILIIGAFIFLIVGTIGLLINKYAFNWGRCATLTFAVINIVGLATLAFINWGMKRIPKT